ncbi:hypothetical protein MesoLjLc_49470 [Mesorhizobium sp. L-8-10]|uniref:hypothetical protein n=1 Tax=Mesorhizobium sp. L-8-10 TaxID=2744523 RepID=UPI0019264630|nr:hypothetical protein [Mesorhizobium sp. L-8-10]BCH33017.1 hypothetical protein MesoLjLc_49470 [Mesorhizobium sp. L-8-10]
MHSEKTSAILTQVTRTYHKEEKGERYLCTGERYLSTSSKHRIIGGDSGTNSCPKGRREFVPVSPAHEMLASAGHRLKGLRPRRRPDTSASSKSEMGGFDARCSMQDNLSQGAAAEVRKARTMAIEKKIRKSIDPALDRLVAENPELVPATATGIQDIAGWFIVESLEAARLTALQESDALAGGVALIVTGDYLPWDASAVEDRLIEAPRTSMALPHTGGPPLEWESGRRRLRYLTRTRPSGDGIGLARRPRPRGRRQVVPAQFDLPMAEIE